MKPTPPFLRISALAGVLLTLASALSAQTTTPQPVDATATPGEFRPPMEKQLLALQQMLDDAVGDLQKVPGNLHGGHVEKAIAESSQALAVVSTVINNLHINPTRSATMQDFTMKMKARAMYAGIIPDSAKTHGPNGEGAPNPNMVAAMVSLNKAINLLQDGPANFFDGPQIGAISTALDQADTDIYQGVVYAHSQAVSTEIGPVGTANITVGTFDQVATSINSNPKGIHFVAGPPNGPTIVAAHAPTTISGIKRGDTLETVILPMYTLSHSFGDSRTGTLETTDDQRFAYYVESSGKLVGTMQIWNDPTQPFPHWRVDGAAHGEEGGITGALDTLAAVALVKAGSYEARLLRYDSLSATRDVVDYTVIWLKSNSDAPDLVYCLDAPFAPPPGIRADTVYTAEKFVKSAQAAAQNSPTP